MLKRESFKRANVYESLSEIPEGDWFKRNDPGSSSGVSLRQLFFSTPQAAGHGMQPQVI